MVHALIVRQIMTRLNCFLFLASCGIIASVQADVVVYPDERSLLIGLREFNASKRATVSHEGARYLIYSGGRGSGIRRFNAFVFREDQAGLILLHQFSHDPLSGEGHDPIICVSPEITDHSIRLVRTASSPRGIVVRPVWEQRFEKLKTMPAVGFGFRFESDATLNLNGEQGGTGQPATQSRQAKD